MKNLKELKEKRSKLKTELKKVQEQIEKIEPRKVESSGGCTSLDLEL